LGNTVSHHGSVILFLVTPWVGPLENPHFFGTPTTQPTVSMGNYPPLWAEIILNLVWELCHFPNPAHGTMALWLSWLCQLSSLSMAFMA
jgi:hypothetical protein